jgi:hypothetical protein
MLNFDAAYITNRKLETDIISYLSEIPEEQLKSKAIIDGLVHRLPFLQNASLDSLVNVRHKESEAFEVYRDAVTEIIKDIKDEIDSKKIKIIIAENIEPKLHKIDQILKNHKDEFTNNGKQKVVFNSILFTAGLFVNQFTGMDLKTILGLGGAYKLGKIYSDFSMAKKIPNQVKNSDYYFLWKLDKGTR